MSTKIIGATLQVDTGNSNANIKEVNQNLAATKTALNDTGTAATNSGKAISDATGNFTNLKTQMAALPGPLKDAGDGVTSLGEAFKALLANPVVLVLTALVGVLALLYKSFTNTFEGGEKMEQVFAGIKAAAGAVLDAIFNLGGAIIKFFSGDFTGAFNQAKQAITGVVSAVQDAYSQTAALTAQLQDLHKQQLAADLASAQRGADLAKLREQALDPDVPVAKRKELLTQLAKVEDDAATADIARTQKVATAKIALLSIGTDAAKKNQDEITKIRVDAINQQTDAENERRRIERAAKQADKEEAAQDKADKAAAAAQAKKDREQLEAYNSQLTKLQQQNVLAGITDQYAKEKQLLENKIADEQALIAKEYADGKITKEQRDALNAQQAISSANQRKALEDKHQQDVADQEQKFQTQLADIRGKAQVDGIVNNRAKEKVQIEISHQQDLAQAILDYGANSDQFFQIKQAIDAEYAAKQAALDEANRIADQKKKLDDAKKNTSTVLNDPKSAYAARQAAIDAEQKQVQAAFNAKALTESEYNDDIEQLSEDRIKIKQEEQKQTSMINNAIGDAFNTLADIAGKQTVAGKALAIAGTTIKTIQAGFDAFAGMVAEIPGPVGIALGIVAAAGAVAAGVKAVEGILAVQVPGQASAGGSVPSISAIPTAPIAPTQSSTILPQSNIDAIGNAATGRTYVLSGDVASNAERDARLSRAARLGG